MIKKGLLLLFVVSIALLLAAAWMLFPSFTREELELRNELQSLQYGESVPLSRFTPLRAYNTICMLDAYAVRSGARQEESLARIFGPIDYSQFRDEIIQRYSNYYAVGIYPVKNNKLFPAIRIAPGRNAYIKAAKSIPFVEPKYFMFGCHSTKDVCFQKIVRDSYGEQPITIGLCNPSNNNEGSRK